VPIYDYRCKQCGHRFERIQGHADVPVTVCPQCQGEVERLITAASVQFKGSGWYATDYAKKTGGSGSAGSDSKSEPAAPAAEKPAEKKESTPSAGSSDKPSK
jgi:putative FmdB family regulatory protein